MSSHLNLKPLLLCAAAVLSLAAGHACRAAPEEIDCGLFYRRDTDVYGNERRKALGPLFESRRSPAGDRLWALRPMYSYMLDARDSLWRCQMLYPALMAKGKDAEWDGHFLLLLSYHDFDVNNPRSKYRLWLVPVYFQGRDMHGANYAAVFPLFGSIREFLVFDEIRFALFPVAVQTRTDDVKTTAALWPIISRTTGGGNDRLSVFPLYGYSRLREESDKYYLLWPFWTHARYAPPQSPGYGYVLFPVYGRVKLENQESLMLAPPLFRFAESEKQNLVYCPWPFLQFSSGEVEKSYVWPLWGKKRRGPTASSFCLWPLYNRYEQGGGLYEHTRTMLFPFVYATSTRGPFDNPARTMQNEKKTLKIWPLFSYTRDADELRLAVPSLFPYRDYDAIDRNYSALWTVFSRQRYKDRAENELLWGLARYRRWEGGSRFSLFPFLSLEKGGDSRHFNWSLLGGLMAHEKAGGKQSFRLLYFFKF